MIVEFYTPGTGIDDAVITYVRDEIIKIHRQHKNISRADILFGQKKRQTGVERVCEIRLFIAGNTVAAKSICKNFDHASQKAIAALNENLALNLKQKISTL